MPDLSALTDAELEAERDRLAEVRTATRLAQLAVQAELDIRASIAAMSPATRAIFYQRVGGSIGPTGETEVAS